MPRVTGTKVQLTIPKLDWKHYGDDKHPEEWLEASLDKQNFMYLRGPDAVMERIKQMVNDQGRETVERIFSREGAVEIGRTDGLTYFRGPKTAMLKMITIAQKSGPGPLERLFMED
jgi:uncharacterized protein YkuJ